MECIIYDWKIECIIFEIIINGCESMGNIDLKNFMKLLNEFLGNIRKEWCFIYLSIYKIFYLCNKIVIKL